MKSFKSHLQEKRSHPDQNPKLSAYKQLEKYRFDSDIYISFTSVDKIGINPQSKYFTPNGIYTYPLKQIWKGFDHRKEKISAPYGDDRQYIWILRKSCNNFVEDLYKDYTSKSYDNDMAKIRKIYAKTFKQDSISKETLKKLKSDYSNITDSKLKTKYDDSIQRLEDPVGWIIDNATKRSKAKNPATSFWNVTRWLANNGIDPNVASSSQKIITNQWNSILRKLGYCGFADKSGKGIIHPSEPMQAVFLSKSAFEVVDKIWNINPAPALGPYGIYDYVSDFEIKISGKNITWKPMTIAAKKVQLAPEVTTVDFINKSIANVIMLNLLPWISLSQITPQKDLYAYIINKYYNKFEMYSSFDIRQKDMDDLANIVDDTMGIGTWKDALQSNSTSTLLEIHERLTETSTSEEYKTLTKIPRVANLYKYKKIFDDKTFKNFLKMTIEP